MKLDPRRLHPRHWNLRLLWDLFMVWVAVINLTLIVFDLSYLLLRPTYLRYVPPVLTVYDPVKGIEPHPLTEELLAETEAVEQLLALDPEAPGLAPRLAKLRRLSLRAIQENPFERANQTHALEVFKLLIAQELERPTLELDTTLPLDEAVESFWTSDPELLERRLALFDTRLRPLLAVNYYREVNLNGRLVDHFWLIDLPFLLLFVVEFAARWAFAVRRRTHARWFFFPIFNWYDLIGLIPYTQFRVFRLFRIASIYMRLRRSELSRVGKDVLSRAVAYVSNIIAEEISDAVSLRILNETQAEIRDGTHRRILEATLGKRREQLEAIAVAQIRDVVRSPDVQERLRGLLRMNLDKAVEESDALHAVPLPNAVLRPLVRSVGEIVGGATLDSVAATLDSAEGRAAARELVRTILERLLEGPLRDEIDALGSEISLEVIEHMKEAVSVKKWAKPGL